MKGIEELDLLDRCIVCGSERADRKRREISITVGGAYAEMTIRVEYCADNAHCGEEVAVQFAEGLVAPFVVADLRRRRLGLFDLGVPE